LRTAVLGLRCTWENRDPTSEDARVDRQHRYLALLLDHARERFDPAVHWEEYREIVWAGRDLRATSTPMTDHLGGGVDGDAAVGGER
jgi:hypothetical protein